MKKYFLLFPFIFLVLFPTTVESYQDPRHEYFSYFDRLTKNADLIVTCEVKELVGTFKKDIGNGLEIYKIFKLEVDSVIKGTSPSGPINLIVSTSTVSTPSGELPLVPKLEPEYREGEIWILMLKEIDFKSRPWQSVSLPEGRYFRCYPSEGRIPYTDDNQEDTFEAIRGFVRLNEIENPEHKVIARKELLIRNLYNKNYLIQEDAGKELNWWKGWGKLLSAEEKQKLVKYVDDDKYPTKVRINLIERLAREGILEDPATALVKIIDEPSKIEFIRVGLYQYGTETLTTKEAERRGLFKAVPEAIKVLRELGDKRAFKALLDIFMRKRIDGVVWALKEIDEEEAIRQMKRILTGKPGSPDYASASVRFRAAAALNYIKTESAMEALVEGINDENRHVRSAVAGSFKSMENGEEKLRKMAEKNESPEIREAARKVLKEVEKLKIEDEELRRRIEAIDSGPRKPGEVEPKAVEEPRHRPVKPEKVKIDEQTEPNPTIYRPFE
jgi:regulator of replication initiation timing